MLGRAKQVSFVGVSDLDAAQRFYGGVLGLDLTDSRPFALVHDTPTGQIRITAVEEVRAAPYTVLGWVLEDLEGEIDRLAAAGASLLDQQFLHRSGTTRQEEARDDPQVYAC